MSEKTITNNQADRIIVRPHWAIMLVFGSIIRETVRKVINRAFERGKIDSRAYHELHALAVRALGPAEQQKKMLLPAAQPERRMNDE